MTGKILSRRTILKGVGVSITMPFMESLFPAWSWATENTPPTPRRMAFFYVPNGVHMPDWTPSQVGDTFTLPRTLEPLEQVKNELLVMSGLTCDKARANGDGPGDHARAMSAFLTGCQPFKTNGRNIRVGVSVDQFAAQRLGNTTRFNSLEMGLEGGRQSGNCDSGYSCAYSNNISWRSARTPNPKETNPRILFDRLFGGDSPRETDQNRELRDFFNRSILDYVRDDAQRLRSRLGSTDRRRMDEYLTSVREIEQRVQNTGRENANVGMNRPEGTPSSYADHARLMLDILVLAFRGDLTRIATFVFANEGSNRAYRDLGIREGHHSLSHHRNDRRKQEQLARINRMHMTHFAYFLNQLRSIREGDRTLLDNSMIMYGSGNGDGNRHNHHDLPILFAGRGGNTITTGRHVRYDRDTPLNNLFLSMLDRMGTPTDRLGDSTGRLPNLTT